MAYDEGLVQLMRDDLGEIAARAALPAIARAFVATLPPK